MKPAADKPDSKPGPAPVPGFLQKWLWMRQLDYGGIFWTLFSVKVGLTCAAFAVAFLFLWLNLWQASKGGTGRTDSRTAPGRGPGCSTRPNTRTLAFSVSPAAARSGRQIGSSRN
jgi:hypothetical protein